LQEAEAGMGIILNVWAELISPGIRKADKWSDFMHGNEILGLPKNYRFLLAEWQKIDLSENYSAVSGLVNLVVA
jgi:hypothetical protein